MHLLCKQRYFIHKKSHLYLLFYLHAAGTGEKIFHGTWKCRRRFPLRCRRPRALKAGRKTGSGGLGKVGFGRLVLAGPASVASSRTGSAFGRGMERGPARDTAVAARKAVGAGGSRRTARCRTGGRYIHPHADVSLRSAGLPKGRGPGAAPARAARVDRFRNGVRSAPEPGRYRAEATPPAADASLRGTGKPEADRGHAPRLRAGAGLTPRGDSGRETERG